MEVKIRTPVLQRYPQTISVVRSDTDVLLNSKAAEGIFSDLVAV